MDSMGVLHNGQAVLYKYYSEGNIHIHYYAGKCNQLLRRPLASAWLLLSGSVLGLRHTTPHKRISQIV